MRAVFLFLAMVATPAMAETYFAHVGSDNIVDQVIVAEPGAIQKNAQGVDQWIQTYIAPEPGQPKNYAGIGYKWDVSRNCFIAPAPPDNVGLDEVTCQWLMPVARPK